MKECCNNLSHPIKEDFDKDFLYILTNNGDTEYIESMIKNYSFMINLLNRYLEKRKNCKIFINSIKIDFERDFWGKLTSAGDKKFARYTITHYSSMYNILNEYLKINEKEYIKESINKINIMLTEQGEAPEKVVLVD